MSNFAIIVAALEANNCTAIDYRDSSECVVPVQYVIQLRGCCFQIMPDELVNLNPIRLNANGTPRITTAAMGTFDARGVKDLSEAVVSHNARYARARNMYYDPLGPYPGTNGFINALVELKHRHSKEAIETLRTATVLHLTEMITEINTISDPAKLKEKVAEMYHSVNVK